MDDIFTAKSSPSRWTTMMTTTATIECWHSSEFGKCTRMKRSPHGSLNFISFRCGFNFNCFSCVSSSLAAGHFAIRDKNKEPLDRSSIYTSKFKLDETVNVIGESEWVRRRRIGQNHDPSNSFPNDLTVFLLLISYGSVRLFLSLTHIYDTQSVRRTTSCYKLIISDVIINIFEFETRTHACTEQ